MSGRDITCWVVVPEILLRQYATNLKARVCIRAIGICEATFLVPSSQYTVMYSWMAREASPRPPPCRFFSLTWQDKPVKKYTSSTSKGMGSSSITNCNQFGSQYPINNYSREISDLMDEISKYFSSLHCLKALNVSGWLSASLLAPSCSLSCHVITIMSRPTNKHQSSSSTIHFTEKCLKKLSFWYRRWPSWPVPACKCGLAKDPPCVGPFTCVGSLWGLHVHRFGPMELCYSGQKLKILKTRIK